MVRRFTCIALLSVCCVAFFSTSFASAADAPASPYKVLQTYVLGGEGSWDYVTVDSVSHKIYIGRADRVMIADTETGKLLGEMTGFTGVHGIAVIPELGRGYVSSGKDDTVRVVDLTTLKETGQIKAGKKPDAIIYDPFSKMVLCCNNGGTTATVVDPAKNVAVGDIELGGAPEFAVADGKGKVFINLEDKSEIVEVDVAGKKVTQHWPLAPGTEPTGLSMDIEHGRLFSGCRGSKTMEVVDAATGKVVASPAIGAGVDATAFDPQAQDAFSSNGQDGTLTVVHEDNPGAFTVTQTLTTVPNARTMALDPATHKLWLVAGTGRSGPKREFTLICVGK